ncbi:MAG: hypothetical protein LBS55_05965, partial [Prevotellaceae bacterium]|nr:hypothetical protein [Prevotellaceae bacterium]
DLYNEPGNSNSEIKPQLVQNIFAWAREVNPTQPLTIGAWLDFNNELSQLFCNSSDIVSFHAYDRKDGTEKKINWAHESGRPAICTEWLLRAQGNTPEVFLPLFYENKVGAYNWGLVEGRTQTYYPWGSPKDAPEPEIWQHDLIRRDGTPHIPAEREIFRKYSQPKNSNQNMLE